MRLFTLIFMTLCFALGAGSAMARCDYKFSGRLMVQHNGKKVPLRNVKVRVKRRGGTGAGRKYVTTDSRGRFSGAWRFDRDRNGRLPGGRKIRFAVQVQFRDGGGLVKVARGGWGGTPWDTFEKVEGKDCMQFILKTHVFNTDGKRDTKFTQQRAFIYAVHERLLRKLKAKGVGLKKRIEVIYPDRHIYSRKSSWFIHKSHLEKSDWDDVRTQIHEVMHQWDINWMKGEHNLVCIADAHHKPPSRWASSRCSGFMEGFAEGAAQALFNEFFAGRTFYSTRNRYRGPQSHEDLRNDTDSSGSVQNTDEAERNDDGWRNFLQFVMWKDEWAPFDDEDTVPLRNCQPSDVNIFTLLKALKAERMNKAGFFKGKTTFASFTNVMRRRVDGFSRRDARFYRLFGDPALSAEDIQERMCKEELAASRKRGEEFRREAMSRLQDDLPPQVDVGQGLNRNPGAAPKGGLRADFGGVWKSSHGELRLHQTNGYLIGDYADRGIIVGRVEDRCAAGVFTNGDRSGVFRFNRAGNTPSFRGKWAWHGKPLNSAWNGRRKSARGPGRLSNFDPAGASPRIGHSGSSQLDGRYESNFGGVDFIVRDRLLIGDYGRKQVLAGIASGNAFIGRFTNGRRAGWFKFAFDANGSFQAGKWGWGNGGAEGQWRLTKKSSHPPAVDNLTKAVSCP